MPDIDRRTAVVTTVAGVGTLGSLGTIASAVSAQGAPAREGGKLMFTVAHTTVPVVGSAELFPVRRIYCIGRNYAAHAREMGSDPNREPPFYFQKPSDAVQVVPVGTVADHPYPTLTKNYHHEVELVAFLKSGGRDIPADKALEHVYGYAVGLDMTRRDLQNAMKSEQKPWEIGKAFDYSAPMGPIHPASKVGHLTKGRISVAVNGQIKQDADLDQMIWSVAEQIAQLSKAFELKAGDIIYSGTPENVGPVTPGDVMLCKIEGLADMSVKVVKT
jgi:2-keto-4-pentenoate hydratase/2-oxohepta-3-ene-1,7-dioic acid hydratase in catechol pathway